MINALSRRCLSGSLVIGLATASLTAPLLFIRSAHSRDLRVAALQVRRQGNSVSLVVVGVGARARLKQQKQSSFSWEGRIISPDASGLTAGVQQRMSLPAVGLEQVILLEDGDDHILRVVSDQNNTLSAPQISANGQDLIVRLMICRLRLWLNQLRGLTCDGLGVFPSHASHHHCVNGLWHLLWEIWPLELC